jgi:hypothetical protein
LLTSCDKYLRVKEVQEGLRTLFFYVPLNRTWKTISTIIYLN